MAQSSSFAMMHSSAFATPFTPRVTAQVGNHARSSLSPSRFAGAQLPHRASRCALPPHAKRAPTKTTPVCYADSSRGRGRGGRGDDDDDDDDGFNDEDFVDDPDILLTDSESGRTLPVGVQHTIHHKGSNYVVCYPIDDPVAFAHTNDAGELDAVHDQAVIDRLFPNAEAVLSEEQIILKNTPFVLTVDDMNDGLDDEDDEDEDEDDDEVGAGEADRAVEVLAEFLSDGKSYCVVRPVEEVLLVAKEINEGLAYHVLSQPELDEITPIVEEFIENLDPQLSIQ